MAWSELALFQADAAIEWFYTPATEATLFRVRYLGSPRAWGRILIGQASPYAPRERLNVRRFYVNTSNSDLYQTVRPSAWATNQSIACRPYAWSSTSGLSIGIDAWIGTTPAPTDPSNLDIYQQLLDLEAKIDAL